jgi:hypothetical protein
LVVACVLKRRVGVMMIFLSFELVMEPPSILSVVSLIFGLVRGLPLIFLVLLLSLLLLVMVLFLILLVLLNESSDTVLLNRTPANGSILSHEKGVLFNRVRSTCLLNKLK